MPDIEQTLYSLTQAHAGLTTLVGTRISPMHTIQPAERPCITFMRVSGGYSYTHDGPDELQESLWQFDIWAASMATARAVHAQLLAALSGDSPANGYYSFLDNVAHDYEPDTGTYRIITQLRVWHRV